jgi:hypothetical protein
MPVGDLDPHVHFRRLFQPSLETFESLPIGLVELFEAVSR